MKKITLYLLSLAVALIVFAACSINSKEYCWQIKYKLADGTEMSTYQWGTQEAAEKQRDKIEETLGVKVTLTKSMRLKDIESCAEAVL